MLGGPYFDDLAVGDVLDAPSLTLTDGLAAVHAAIVGNRLALSLDERLSAHVTGADRMLAAPALVWDVAMGQSSLATQRGLANLFYRGLVFRRAASLGDTLRTTTEIAGLKQNRSKPTGLALLRIVTMDQHDREVLSLWRCGMLPMREPGAQTGHADDVANAGDALDDTVLAKVTEGWDLARFREAILGPAFDDLEVGTTWDVEGGDVVSSAPELARLTLNLAAAHHDRTGNAEGARLGDPENA